jgi:hypothetical protein
MAEIYAHHSGRTHYSGRNGIVRYVGETSRSRRDREHIRDSYGALRSWFRKEWQKGYPIRCALLQSVKVED